MCIVLETLARRYKICGPADEMTAAIEEKVFITARQKQNLEEPTASARIEYRTYLEIGRTRLPSYIHAEFKHGQ